MQRGDPSAFRRRDKHRPPSQLITIAVHPMKQMTVAMADTLYRPSSCRNIEEASRANCHSSDIRSDFLALCHHCPDDIASLVALVCCSTGGRTCSSFKIHLAGVMYDALPFLQKAERVSRVALHASVRRHMFLHSSLRPKCFC